MYPMTVRQQVGDLVTITGIGTVDDPFVAIQQVGDNTLDGVGTIADPFSVIYSPSAGNANTLDGIDSSGFMPNATVSTGEKVVTRTSTTVEVTLDVLEQYLNGSISDFTTLAEINAISAYANATVGQRF
jgi:hypothetical protein